MIISMKRKHSVILAIIGVLLGVAFALSPRGALADTVDVLTIGGVSYTLDESVTSSITETFVLDPGVTPVPPFTFNLQETDPVTGLGLVDATGIPIISDILQVGSIFLGQVQVGCGAFDILGNCTQPIYTFQAAQTFTLTSDTGSSGLPFGIGSGSVFLESPGGNSFGPFGSFGLVTVTSDIDAATVPEPSTWLLLGSGLAGLAAWRRWRPA